MAISTSMRNVAFCYPFALNEFAHTDVILPIIAFSAISIVMNMGLALELKLREKYGRAH
jgi:predicted Na+-dependent transporter